MRNKYLRLRSEILSPPTHNRPLFFTFRQDALQDEASVHSESDIGGLLHDIHEALLMARDERVDVPLVRILRILAGEGAGRFGADHRGPSDAKQKGGVPLAAAMDYVGAVLDDAGRKIRRLQVRNRSVRLILGPPNPF